MFKFSAPGTTRLESALPCQSHGTDPGGGCAVVVVAPVSSGLSQTALWPYLETSFSRRPSQVAHCTSRAATHDAALLLSTVARSARLLSGAGARAGCRLPKTSVSPPLRFGHTAGTIPSSGVVTIHSFVHSTEIRVLGARHRDRQSTTEFSRERGDFQLGKRGGIQEGAAHNLCADVGRAGG